MKRLKETLSSPLGVFFIVFGLIFVRYCYFGFEYYYQLDDYIQYHNYYENAKYSGGISAVISKLGLLAARPLAGIFDIAVWSHFFPVMIVACALISAMYAACACIFKSIWSRYFGTGYLFVVIFSVLPLAFEGTYWISASSRIVVGLFFAAVSLYFFELWCRVGLRRHLVFYAVLQLIGYGFYEQVLVFSITAVILVAALNFKEHRHRSLWSVLSVLNALVYFAFTGLFKDSALYGGRMGVVLPVSRYYFETIFPNVTGQVRSAFIGGGFYTLVKGAYRGLQMLVRYFNPLYLVAVSCLCAGLYTITREDAGHEKTVKPLQALIVGLLLVAAPVSLFFVIENSWFSLRSCVMSLCGIALIIDTLYRFAVCRVKTRGVVTGVAVAVVAVVCCIASVSELYDYRATTRYDAQFSQLLAETLRTDGAVGRDRKVAVLNVEPSYLENQNYFYHEHIHGVTESSWALTGAVERFAGFGRAVVTPMPQNPAYRPWNYEASQLSNFDDIYMYLNGGFLKVNAVKNGAHEYHLYDGERYAGRVWEEDKYGYLEFAG